VFANKKVNFVRCEVNSEKFHKPGQLTYVFHNKYRWDKFIFYNELYINILRIAVNYRNTSYVYC